MTPDEPADARSGAVDAAECPAAPRGPARRGQAGGRTGRQPAPCAASAALPRPGLTVDGEGASRGGTAGAPPRGKFLTLFGLTGQRHAGRIERPQARELGRDSSAVLGVTGQRCPGRR